MSSCTVLSFIIFKFLLKVNVKLNYGENYKTGTKVKDICHINILFSITEQFKVDLKFLLIGHV